LRNQSAMRNWYNCWYIYVTKEPQSHHTRSVSFSIEFIRFALHSHFPRTCRRDAVIVAIDVVFSSRKEGDNPTQLISSPPPSIDRKIPFQYFTTYTLSLLVGCAFLIRNTLARNATRRDATVAAVESALARFAEWCIDASPILLSTLDERAAPETARDSNLHRPFSDPENTWRLTADYTTVPCFTACQKSVYSGYRRGQLPPPRSCRRPIMEQLWSHRVTRGGTIRIINGCFSLSLGVCVCVCLRTIAVY